METKESILKKLMNKAENMDRTIEKGIINGEKGSSIRMNDKGDITIAANEFVQYKMHHAQGSATEISMQSNTITNRKNIKTDELIINKHKLNPQIYELTDMKELNNNSTLAIGNMTILGTVLVKAWEPNLKKYVLIRRSIRTPLFSNLLNVPNSPEGMAFDDDITKDLEKIRTIKLDE